MKQFFEATLVKKIWQNISRYQMPLLWKYYKHSQILGMKVVSLPLNSLRHKVCGKILLYVLEIDQFAIDHGILRESFENLCHLIRDDTSYLSFSDFKERYNIKTNFLTFQGVISAIKSLLKTYDVNNDSCDTKYENLIDTFLKTSKPCRLAYKILVEKTKEPH